jgi:hypothetical protein
MVIIFRVVELDQLQITGKMSTPHEKQFIVHIHLAHGWEAVMLLWQSITLKNMPVRYRFYVRRMAVVNGLRQLVTARNIFNLFILDKNLSSVKLVARHFQHPNHSRSMFAVVIPRKGHTTVKRVAKDSLTLVNSKNILYNTPARSLTPAR